MKHLLRTLVLTMVLCMVMSNAMAAPLTAAEITNPDTDTIIKLDHGLPTPELPLVSEPITLTVMYMRETNHGNFDDMWFLEQVAKDTGITLKIIPVEKAGWTEKMNLAFAADDLPDIFLRGLTPSDASKYGMNGSLIPLNALLEQYAPNANYLLNNLPNARRNVLASDGNIYYMPAYQLTARDQILRIGAINTAWIDELGMNPPHTIDELYEVLKAFRDNDLDGDGDSSNEIPLSFIFSMDNTDKLQDGSLAILSGYGYVDHRHDVIDGKYVYVPMENNYREYLKFMNKLWEEDILDHEIFTQTEEQYLAKCQNYTVGLLTKGEASQYFSDDEKKRAYSLVGPLLSEVNQTPCWPAESLEATPQTASFAITSKCKNPEAAIKLLDYFYSDYCSTLTKCGPEKGQWNGEGGWSKHVSNDGNVSYSIEFDNQKYNSFWDFRIKNGLMNMPYVYSSDQAAIVLGADVYASMLSSMVFDSGCYDARREGYPNCIAFTEEEQNTLAMFILLDNQVSQWCAQFISGEKDIEDDKVWAQYISMIESMDVDTLIEIRQTAYDRWTMN